MGESDKRYEAFRIFEQIQDLKENLKNSPKEIFETKPAVPLSGDKKGDMYYEIEYDSCPMPGVGRYVLKSNKIEAPQKDEIRERFNQMRNIAREGRQLRFHTKFYDKRVQEENSRIFYKQGVFMADFEDTYEKSIPYSSYFPDYQMMGYEQLRTYFTWRTQVRQGNITDISLSYAFLYIYELLNNIGVENPEEGLDRLVSFWDAFRVYDKTIDKYVIKWLKDYHIYYELPHSFREFIEENNLGVHYPKLSDSDDNFVLFCSISKYDIRKSVFYGENKEEIEGCFHYVMDKLKMIFEKCGLDFEEFIFQRTKNMSVWTPFKEALFYPHLKQNDRRVVLSEKEIYICSGNSWTFNTAITTDSGKKLIGYCMKQMEAVLRKIKNYKYKLSADISMLSPVMEEELKKSGISLETAITQGTMEFYREANKTVVRVDREVLDRIRQEALITQEKLIVPEQTEVEKIIKEETGKEIKKELEENVVENVVIEETVKEELIIEGKVIEAAVKEIREENEEIKDKKEDGETKNKTQEINEKKQREIEKGYFNEEGHADLISDAWADLKTALTEVERKALFILLHGSEDIRKFADRQNVMLEVLVDGINEKAMDNVGDSLLDGEFAVYEDYMDQVSKIVEGI